MLLSGRWFTAQSGRGPWQFVKGGAVPEDFKKIPEDSPKENVLASVPDTPEAEEAVIANLIPETVEVKRSEAKMTDPLFDGEPQLATIEGTSLQYVINTPTPMIRTASGFYAADNGARYTAAGSKGPWRLADKVPPEIYSIPPNSPVHYVT